MDVIMKTIKVIDEDTLEMKEIILEELLPNSRSTFTKSILTAPSGISIPFSLWTSDKVVLAANLFPALLYAFETTFLFLTKIFAIRFI